MHVTARTNRTEQGTSGRTETGRGSLVNLGNGSWKMMGFPVPGTPRNWGFQSLGVSES